MEEQETELDRIHATEPDMPNNKYFTNDLIT